MPKTELTNMVMIQDRATGKVLVQDRIISWKGLSFPGGHVEDGESFVDSAVREVKEETGLDVYNLKSCGLIHWAERGTADRYLVFLYKTSDYSGTLTEECPEGRNFWVTLEEFRDTPSENNAVKYLPMFLDDSFSEAYAEWSADEEWSFVFK